jgi:hypothetical protein
MQIPDDGYAATPTGFSATKNPTGGYVSLYDYYKAREPKNTLATVQEEPTSTPELTQVRATQPPDVIGSVAKVAGDVGGFLFPQTKKAVSGAWEATKANLKKPYAQQVKENFANLGVDTEAVGKGLYNIGEGMVNADVGKMGQGIGELAPSAKGAAVTAMGPLATTLGGTQWQRQANAAGAEIAPMVMGGMSAKGLVNLTKLVGPKTANLIVGKAGATMAPRLMGAISGGMRAAFSPEEQNIAQRAGATALGTGLGWGTGMVMEGGRKVAEAVSKQAGNTIHRLMKPNPTQVGEFELKTGWKFGDKIAENDLRNIKGMNWDQMKDYFVQKSRASNLVADQELAKIPATLSRNEFVAQIDKQIAELKPEAGRAMQDSAIAALEKAKEDLAKNPEKLSLVVANQLKRDFQDAGDAAFGLTSSANPASEANAGVSTMFKQAIEKAAKAAGVDIADINKTTMLYHLAKQSVIKEAARAENRLANDFLGKIIAIAPALGAYIGFTKGGYKGAAMGAAGISGVGGMRIISQSPEFQTLVARAAQGTLDAASSKVVQGITNFLTYQATQGTNVAAQAIMRKLFPKQEKPLPPVQNFQNTNDNGTLTTAE